MPVTFSSLGVSERLVSCLASLGIVEPYPIQSATLPEALAGADLFAQSPTGSGKTLAFAIPLVARIGEARSRRPRALVLAPTRELAAQIAQAMEPLASVANRRVIAIYGGVGYKEQLSALGRGVDIVVGCPGRLIDLLERGAINLADVEVVVVDEADRMADMGFLPAVRQLLDEIHGARQTMLFSATLTRDVERLVRDYQNDPRRHVLELATDDVGKRRHEFWTCKKEERAEVTAQFVAGQGSSIVFCRTKHGVDRLAHHLSRGGVSAVAIHGDRTQAQRERALEHFRARKAQVLVGTDVASRGIHVDGVDCVVHYDPPEDDDTYVHRSGRTGRAGASGLVVSLVSPDQEAKTKHMVGRLGLGASLSRPPISKSTLTHVANHSVAQAPGRAEYGAGAKGRPMARGAVASGAAGRWTNHPQPKAGARGRSRSSSRGGGASRSNRAS